MQSEIADRKTYLAGAVKELEKRWPGNRTVNIVCHGHSVPAGYAAVTVETFDAYPYLLHRELKTRYPHAVINVVVTAIGGENSAAGAARFKRDALVLRPDVVLIDYALNDRGLELREAKAAWTTMIEQAGAQGVKLLLLTPTGDSNTDIFDPENPLNRHAEQIRNLADEYGTGLVDSYAAFQRYVESGGRLEDLMASFNHPNRSGHQLVVKEIIRWFA